MAVTDGAPAVDAALEAADPQFDRTPPQDVAAEQSVLGGMMLSKDAIADVVEVLRAADFYRPAHATIFDAILDLYGRGEPADPITVTAALTDAGTINRVGGMSYLHDLVHTVPTAANAAYYARIVAERAVLRRLVEAGTRIVQLGYGAAGGGGRDTVDVVDLAQQAVYEVTERRISEEYQALRDVLQPTLDEIESIGSRGGVMTGVPTGFADLDALLHGLHPGQLIVVAGRPGLGKSTASLDVVRHASVRHGLTSAIFSLEMSKVEIVMRVLSAEARIPLHVLRSGQLSDDDWTKLARRMGEISEAPLFIDDTPNMTLMEIRAKARRLRQRHDLKLLVVDYLQLMTSPRRVESRQQEVSELSRGLKLLAKEVDCPVIAVAQLNRGPEQRTDKRPQLSDLRECLTGDTLVTRADNGARVPIRDLVGQRDVPVWTLDERQGMSAAVMSEVWSTGVRPVYRLTLASGRELTATGNHPLLTVAGWRPVDALAVTDHVAVARTVPTPGATDRWPEHEIVKLAHMLSDACTGGSPVSYRSWDEADLRAGERAVPAGIHGLGDDQVAMFLRHLWATGGSVTTGRPGRVRVHCGTTSRAVAADVQALLLRLGIGGRLFRTTADRRRPGWAVDVSAHDDMLALLQVVDGPLGPAHRGPTLFRAGLSRRRMARVAAAVPDPCLSDPCLPDPAGPDVRWDRVVSIEPAGAAEVFDAHVPGTHSFLANDIISHNSGAIEQDSDVVILLHRDDYYDKESPRAGEADFIVAKHRNGPTDTVTVAAQLHFSRFVDMAIG